MQKDQLPWYVLNSIPRDVIRNAEERPPLHSRFGQAALNGIMVVGGLLDWSQDHPVLGRAHRLAHRLYWGKAQRRRQR